MKKILWITAGLFFFAALAEAQPVYTDLTKAGGTFTGGTVAGDIETLITSELASESLTNGSTFASTWSTDGLGFSISGGNAVYTHNASGGKVYQTATNGAISWANSAGSYFCATYIILSKTGSPTLSITTTFAATSTALDTSLGTHTTCFRAKATSPVGNFEFSASSTTGEAITVDTMSLQRVIGGDIWVHGDITAHKAFIGDGRNNTFVGVTAGPSNAQPARGNTGIGQDTLLNITSGEDNVAVGRLAMSTTSTGATDNTAVGMSALKNVNGVDNVGIGLSAGASITGDGNIAIGQNTLLASSTTGSVAVGYRALTALTSGTAATAIGQYALEAMTSDSKTTAVGIQALRSANGGGSNTAIGYYAGYGPAGVTANANTTGYSNTYLGSETGADSTTQRVNTTTIGYRALSTADNQISFGDSSVVQHRAAGLTLTAATMNNETGGLFRTVTNSYLWTNAMIVALGAVTAGDISVAGLPAKTQVVDAQIIITGAASGVTTLTVACGRTSATYIDYLTAQDAKAAANTVYGDASGERGTNLTGWDLPSYTGTTTVYCHFISSGGNLNAVTGSSGRVVLTTRLLP